MVKSAVSLWSMGAQLLVMPCNTAHYFLSQLQKNVEIPILNMIEVTGTALLKKGIKTVGLLATEGTINSRIYQEVFEKIGIDIIIPDEFQQKIISDLIYNGVKAGNKDYDASEIKDVMQSLLNRGAETLVLGCTELPIAVEMYNLDYNVCDPTLELAKAAITAACEECI